MAVQGSGMLGAHMRGNAGRIVPIGANLTPAAHTLWPGSGSAMANSHLRTHEYWKEEVG